MIKWLLRIVSVVAVLLVIAFFVFRTPDTDPATMRAKYGGPPSQFVKIGDGVAVHLRDEGPKDAPAIILLHGSSADLHTWQPWVDGLKSKYRVIRFDQVGHGLTGPDPAGDYAIENFVADIDEVADALKLDRFVLGGNSMGGGHAVAYALAHPERVAGLVLVDAGGAPVRKEEDGGSNLGFSIAQTPVLNQVMRYITPRAIVAQSLSETVSNQAVVTEAAIDRYWELLRYPGNRAATIARFSRDWTTFDAARVRTITAPTLILWGEEDATIPVASGKWYAMNLPNNRFVSYPGIGHLPHEEAAKATLANLGSWLATLELVRDSTNKPR